VSDGRELWIYYPNFKSAERYPLGKGRRSMRCRGDQFRTNMENIETILSGAPFLLLLAQGPRRVA